MAKIHLIEGPVGAGKSTFSKSLAQRTHGIHIPLDEWFAKLFSPDRPQTDFVSWYVGRKRRLLDLVWIHSCNLIESGTDAILELGLIQKPARTAFCDKVIAEGLDLDIYVLDASREIRRERVQQRNAQRGDTFSMVVPDHIFNMASDLWEPPDDDERKRYSIQLINTENLQP